MNMGLSMQIEVDKSHMDQPLDNSGTFNLLKAD